MDRNEYISCALHAAKEYLEQYHFNIIYLCVQGSTNYNLDVYENDYMSDVDLKCFIIPTFESLYFNQKISTVYHYLYGQIEVKDIRSLPELLSKMNPTYLELLCSPYYYTPDFAFMHRIRSSCEQIVEERYPLLAKSLYGTCLSKNDGLCHETPSNKDKIDQFGYEPKQLHHAMRLAILSQRIFLNNQTFKEAISFNGQLRDQLIQVKINGSNLTKDQACQQMEQAVSICKSIKDLFWDGKQLLSEYHITDCTIKQIEKDIYNFVKKQFLASISK